MRKLSVASQFSEFPAGRVPEDGPNSGERFREEFLVPLLEGSRDAIEINLDDTLGYGSSFLDEAFAGLLRNNRKTEKELKERFIFVDSREIYQSMIWDYISEEQARAH
ncbi:STAS-like domain-containing protein [Janthinobacterium psychrotolerans]|uniref:STAS-like domain-containing protein n=1 Tax=Janthinobacterium psychrotolerans TaxID=1747903 RepID=UPI00123771EE|nr:STAS-like domain-containing protein [Janthinobacterium psychrotolerans]